jgi:L-iditol 2-dehydrogenase
MKAVVVEKLGAFRLTDVEIPKPGVREVLVKVAVTGLCRTDLKIIEVGHRDLVLPRIPAEEVVGTVHEAGPDVDQSLMGKRVYIYPGTSCGSCAQCLTDAGNLCASMKIMGFHRDGGFAEYVVAPIESLIEIPENCEFDHAVFSEPLSCCLNALELANLKQGESVAIWGAGPAGTLLARATTALNANPTVIEPCANRRELISGVSQVPDKLFDVAIPATGSSSAYDEAIAHLAPRGRLIAFAGLPHEESLRSVDLNTLHYKELTVVGAYGCSYRHGEQALRWISEGTIQVDDMISHRLPLEELGTALDLVRNRQGMKILLYPNR